MMSPETAMQQASETTETFFQQAQKIFDNWYEGTKDLADHPEILKVLIEAQTSDYQHSFKIKMVDLPER